MASASETVIFIFLGIVTVQNNHDWNWGFVGFTILFASLFRALGKFRFCKTYQIQAAYIKFSM